MNNKKLIGLFALVRENIFRVLRNNKVLFSKCKKNSHNSRFLCANMSDIKKIHLVLHGKVVPRKTDVYRAFFLTFRSRQDFLWAFVFTAVLILKECRIKKESEK